MSVTNNDLADEVKKLTGVTTQLLQVLKDDYPKRSEVEDNFVSKLTQQKFFAVMVVVALITVLGCYVTTIGVYSVCFVGATDNNPGACKYTPGYQERVERLERNERIDQEQQARIEMLERQLNATPGS